MRSSLAASLILVLSLACGGAADVRRDANEALRAEARAQFVSACSRVGPPGVSGVTAEACGCVADEVLRTMNTRELLRFAADPQAAELVPIAQACVKKLAR